MGWGITEEGSGHCPHPCLADCDDKDACTVDSCMKGECVHTPKGVPPLMPVTVWMLLARASWGALIHRVPSPYSVEDDGVSEPGPDMQ